MHNFKACGVYDKKNEDFLRVENWFILLQKNGIQIARPKYHVTLTCDLMLSAKQQTNMDNWGNPPRTGGSVGWASGCHAGGSTPAGPTLSVLNNWIEIDACVITSQNR